MPRNLVTTADGSHSLWWPEYDEHYHSIHGAMQESQHVFMQMGWEQAKAGRDALHILEMGFGTGLNALLACMAAATEGLTVHYSTLEKFPLSETEFSHLNYPAQFPDPALAQQYFEAMHLAPWGQATAIHPQFVLTKWEVDLADFAAESAFDLVFFDAFAPTSQPELWSEAVFAKVFAACKPGAILTTYCAKGSVRRAMLSAGFVVEKVPGPPGKREMLRARKG